jgi:hypothetical protein
MWPMEMNDTIGDCTIAAYAHQRTLWTANRYAIDGQRAQLPEVMSDAACVEEYSRLGGYVPGDASTDQGLVVQDVLHSACNEGIDGDRLAAYVAVNFTDPDELRDSIYWFGGVYLGINVPRSALENTDRWDVVPRSPLEGGHAIMAGKYDADHFYVVSWGKEIPATIDFILKYTEEAYGLISPNFILQKGTTPAGLSLDDMLANSAALHGPKAY